MRAPTFAALLFVAGPALAQAAPPDPGIDANTDSEGGDPASFSDENADPDYYGALAPYGEWRELDDGQMVWVPSEAAVGADFTPYDSDGSWVNTEYGLTWVSDHDWGWLPFHFGRWDYIEEWGWAWWPGRDWGPAWVSWRVGEGYVGWAALPPRARVAPPVSIQVASVARGARWHFSRVAELAVRRTRSVGDAGALYLASRPVDRWRPTHSGIQYNAGPSAPALALVGGRLPAVTPLRSLAHAMPRPLPSVRRPVELRPAAGAPYELPRQPSQIGPRPVAGQPPSPQGYVTAPGYVTRPAHAEPESVPVGGAGGYGGGNGIYAVAPGVRAVGPAASSPGYRATPPSSYTAVPSVAAPSPPAAVQRPAPAPSTPAAAAHRR